jgi:hypothetical protein
VNGMGYKIVDIFLTALTNRFLAKVIKTLLKMAFVSTVILYTDIEVLERKNPKKNKRIEDFMVQLIELVENLKEKV